MVLPTLEPLGDEALLLRWGDSVDPAVNSGVHAFAARLRAAAPAWLVDVVPAYASLAVFFDPEAIAGDDPSGSVAAALEAMSAGHRAGVDDAPARTVEIPVCYGGEHGPDLADVALACGLDPAEVVARHTAADYTVAMIGFAPGFPYLLGLDPALAVPRLATPRVRVAAGSVGIGGAQTGVYPTAGPGGWRLIGRTPSTMFDPGAAQPSRLLPGDRVRFVVVEEEASGLKALPPGEVSGVEALPQHDSGLKALLREPGDIEVIAGGLATTVQDGGRRGWRHLGVGVGGALDAESARVANRLVGNPDGDALLEITLAGPRLRFRRAVRIAITGAPIAATADGVALPGGRPIELPAGAELALGACRTGARAYLAIAGGLDVPIVLGSAATDLRGGFGGLDGRGLAAGDTLVLCAGGEVVDVAAAVVAPWWVEMAGEEWSGLKALLRVRVVAGRDALAPGAALTDIEWTVDARSNRQGLRLQGPALAAADPGERLSEPVAPGTVQLPPDGQPIVLLADAQTVGGYPRIGHVISADLPRLAQLRPGDRLRFELVDLATAQAAACAQRARLTRIGLALEQRRRMDRRVP